MLLTLIILTLIQPFVFTNAESLVDLPLQISNRNIIIHATLVDTISGDIFFLREFISTNSDGIQGKIEIESRTDSSEVHYSTDTNNQRLVVTETICDLFTYKSGWDKKLPGVTKPLLNLLLLLGPSVLYRINRGSNQWTTVPDDDVRGTIMHAATTTMNLRLKMIRYYKTSIDEEESWISPSRIVFEGFDPGAPISFEKENITMDIYLHEETFDELDSIVQIPSGIGCPVYLAQGLPLPSLSAQKIQMIVLENTIGSTSSTVKNEYYVDDDQAIMRLVSTSLGITTDAIYDYNLGLIYIKEERSCITSPLSSSSPGVNEAGYYSLYHLLWLDKPYLHLGQLEFEHRSGFRVRAWEAVEYNQTISSIQYAKVVTTLYFAESKESTTFTGYVLVGATRNAYRQGSANDYILVASVTRDFYDFKEATSETEFESQFELTDCFPDSGSRIELNFQLSCTNTKCYNLAQSQPNEFKTIFKSTILNDKKISPIRVSNVYMKFSPDKIEVFMTFLEGPKIDEPFRKRSVKIDQNFLKKLGPVTANDEKSCLQLQASIVAPIKMVIYCSAATYGNCYHVETTSTIVEDSNGATCDVWSFPLNNLYRVGHELTLEEIHKNMIDKSKYNSISFYGQHYAVDNVLDVTQVADEDTQFPYAISRHSSKLKGDQLTVTTVRGIENFGSCYRACVHEDDDVCESFSYCEYGDTVECLVTSLMYDNIDDNSTVDDKCNIYSKNHLSDYRKVQTRRFKSPTSIAVNLPLYDCATFCYASDDCYSFQYCNGFCTFAGYYTDSASEYRDDCDIYSPKVAHKYQMTGEVTVVDTFHTELNLDMEQCAALCNDWSSADEYCRSFNFCPKGRTSSACYLSKHTVRDGETTQSESSDCYNYELIINTQDNGNKAHNSGSVNGTSSGAAFGIIMLFLVSGAVIGLLVPIGYKWLPSLGSILSLGRTAITPTSQSGFGWTKQVDDEDQSRV